MKVVVTLALLGIIAAAAVMLVRMLLSDSEAGNPRRKLPMYFKCTKCAHEFEISKRDFNLQHKGVEDFSGTAAGKAHCPKCKGRFCAKLRSICPHCKQRVAKAVPGTGDTAGELVCPKCGGVINEAGTGRPRR